MNHDITVFVREKFREMRDDFENLPIGWPGEIKTKDLVQRARGLFIYASTACLFIRGARDLFDFRLAKILSSSSILNGGPEKQLDNIYITVLRDSIRTNEPDEREVLYSRLKCILGSIVILFSPLSVYYLGILLNVTNMDVKQALWNLHTILDIPKD